MGDRHTRWARNRGIALHLSTTEQHEQNGAAEAYNKAIEHKTQSTIAHALPDLDPRYWSPVIEHGITYLRNRSPCRRLPVTPYEAWTGNKPHLANIRVIGCKAYVHKLTADMDKLIGSKANVQRLLGFKGNGQYLVTTDNPKQPQWRYDVDFDEPHPNCTSITKSNDDNNQDPRPDDGETLASELGGETDKATLQPKRVITDTEINESPNKRQRQRAADHESPNANHTGYDHEPQRDSHDHEPPHTGYELPHITNHEPTRRDHESQTRATTPPGYMSKTRPKSVGIDAPPTDLIQEGKRKRKPKHHYWYHQNDASNFNLLLFILMTASLATEPYEPTSYDDARYHSGR